MNEPFTGPVPAHEIAIGRNLRRWRLSQSKKISVAEIGRRINEKKERLTSYENGRNPVAWGVALKLWEVMNVSPSYLATGKGPLFHMFPGQILRSFVPRADAMAKFSEVYNEHLAAFFDGLARSEAPSCIKDIEAFLAEAKAGKIEGAALRAVAETMHEYHQFPRSVVIVSAPDGFPNAHAPDHEERKARILAQQAAKKS